MSTRSTLAQIRREIEPNDLRLAFVDALDAFELWENGEPEPTVEIGHWSVAISVIFKLLSNHSDFMPNHVAGWARDLAVDGQRMAPTYGSAARLLYRMTAEEKANAG